MTIDCPEPAAVTGLYADLPDWPAPAEPDAGFVTLDPPSGGPSLGFQRAEGFQAPTWRAPHVQQQLHVDFVVDDLDAAHERATGLGARLLDTQQSFRVYADPVGHPFCLCACSTAGFAGRRATTRNSADSVLGGSSP